MDKQPVKVPSTETVKAPQSTVMYDKFKYVLGNRDVDRRQVAIIKKSIADRGNLSQYFPVVVNEQMEVIDGQHRVQALKELELPVFYLVIHGATVEDIRVLNSSQKPWAWRDFAKSYADRGNTNYTRFLALADEFTNFRYTAINLFATGKRKSTAIANSGTQFKQGGLDLSEEAYQRARQRLQWMTDLSRITRDVSREFCEGAYQMMTRSRDGQSYNHERMVAALEANKLALNTCYSVSDYFYKLEELYLRG